MLRRADLVRQVTEHTIHSFAEALANENVEDLRACLSAEVTYHSSVMRDPVGGAVDAVDPCVGLTVAPGVPAIESLIRDSRKQLPGSMSWICGATQPLPGTHPTRTKRSRVPCWETR